MNKKEEIISAIASIIIGVLFIVMKDRIIGVAITVLGVVVLISALMDFLAKMTNLAIIKAVVGVCILVFGWLFVNLALYILAAGIILMGLLQISGVHKNMPVNLTSGEKCMEYLKPVVTVVAGACLLLNQSGTISWVFIATGVLLILQGIMSLAGANRY